jgi:hypothetical protein
MLFVGSICLYILALNGAFRQLVVPNYGYYGFFLRTVDSGYLLASWVVCLIPALWLPIAFQRPSQLIVLFLYLSIYIPAAFLMYHSYRPLLPQASICELILILFLGLTIIQVSQKLPLIRIKPLPLPKHIFLYVFGIFCLGLIAYLFVTELSHIRLTLDFAEIYELRASTDERWQQEGGALGSYAVYWLGGFVFPFLYSLGRVAKRRALTLMGLLGPIALYTVIQFKALLFAPVLFVTVDLLLNKKRASFATAFTVMLAGLLVMGLLLNLLPFGGLLDLFAGLVPFRAFSVPAQLMLEYYDFFASHPHTYLSHVRGISSIIEYPYPVALSEVIAVVYYGAGKGANASLWAMDGLAGFGLIGIVLVSIMCGVVLWVFDSLAALHDFRLAGVAISYDAMLLTSGSLFTTLLSGGLLFLMLALWLLPRQAVSARKASLTTRLEPSGPYKAHVRGPKDVAETTDLLR